MWPPFAFSDFAEPSTHYSASDERQCDSPSRTSGSSRLLKKSLRFGKRVGRAKFFAWDELILRNGPLRWVIFASSLRRWTQFARRSQELGQANKIVGSNVEDEHGADLVEAAHLKLCEPGHCLAPAEAFLDAFAQPLADRIAQARRDLARDGGLAHFTVLADCPVDRHVRLDSARLQAFDEGLGVVVLVGAEGGALGQPLAQGSRRLAFRLSRGQSRLGRHHKSVAVLHQRVAEIGKTALLPVAFPKQARILVRRRGVRLVRPLGLAEIRLPIAPWRRRLARAVLGPKALHRRKGLEQCPVD